MNTFRIKEYGRTELAIMYFPTLTPQSAWRKLREWITINRTLSDVLRLSGYNGRQRAFTPFQVQQIIEYLGEP